MPAQTWNLVADIGGTNARFAIHDLERDELTKVIVLTVADHPTFHGALQHLLEHVRKLRQWEPWPNAACLAVACPPDSETISFTNSDWRFTRRDLSRWLNGIPTTLINDFSAIGYAIPHLKPFEWHQLGGATPRAKEPIAIIGPGTGLGMGLLVPTADGYQVVDGEGGHIDFAPVNEREIAIWYQLKKRFPRISAERLLSGDGIVNIYQALCAIESVAETFTSAPQITDAAIKEEDEIAAETLSVFCQVLGSTAGNLALISGAKSGVYIAGGIVPRFVEYMEKSDFRKRFEDKARFEYYMKDIPVRVIQKQHLGLFGAMKKINP
jgi:glucokinase